MPGSSSTKAPNSMILVTFPLTSVPRGYFVGDGVPGAWRELFETERQFAGHAIDLQHLDLHLVACLEQIVDLGDPPPAHLADRQQAVDAADVDEGAEALDRTHDSLVNLAFLERRPGVSRCSARSCSSSSRRETTRFFSR